MLKTIQQALDATKTHLEQLGLVLCPEKTQLVIFSRKKSDLFEHTVKINDQIIWSTDSAKFLGVILDYKLLFNNYLDYLIDKTRKTPNHLSPKGNVVGCRS